jgi:hypothetical protein
MFDRIAVIRCDPPELDILEGIYISRLKPQYNGCGRALLPAAEA